MHLHLGRQQWPLQVLLLLLLLVLLVHLLQLLSRRRSGCQVGLLLRLNDGSRREGELRGGGDEADPRWWPLELQGPTGQSPVSKAAKGEPTWRGSCCCRTVLGGGLTPSIDISPDMSDCFR